MPPNPIRRPADPTSAGDIAAFESRTGLTLPPAYRAFLLASNGGVPRRNATHHTTAKGKRRETWVRHFFPLGRDGLIDFDRPDLEQAHADRPSGLPAHVLLVGAAHYLGNEGFIAVGTEGDSAGKVYFRPDTDPEKATLHPVADDWDAFIDEMKYEDKKLAPWMEAIQDGDADRLRLWLAERRKKWEGDRSVGIDIERCAVEENNWQAVQVLLEFGFGPGDLLEEAVKADRFELAARLLETRSVAVGACEGLLLDGTPFLWHAPPLVAALIDAGADVSREDERGETPLHKAVEADALESVRLLLARGADPTATNDDGRTPLALARRLENTALFDALREAEAAWAASRPPEPPFEPLDLRGVTFRRAGPGLTTDEIRAFEAEVKLTFPPEYRGLLMRVNGGTPSPNAVPIVEPREEDPDADAESDGGMDWEDAESLVTFLALRPEHVAALPPSDDDNSFEQSVLQAREWYHDGTEIPRGMVPIGWLENYGEGAWLLIQTRGKGLGKLYACYYGTTDLKMTLSGLFDLLAASAARPKSPAERLADAVEASDLDGVRAAIADGAVNMWSTRDGRLPVRKAVETGFADAVLLMAASGFDAEQMLSEVGMADDPALVSRYLDTLPKVTKKIAGDLLMASATYTDAALLERLLATGVKVGKPEKYGQSPVFVAVGGGTPEAIRRIIAAGSPAGFVTEHGATAMHQLAHRKDGDLAAIVAVLREHGVPVDAADGRGLTPLHEALRRRNEPAAMALIDAGADPFRKYPIPAPRGHGVSPEKMNKMMARAMKEMESLMSDLGDDEDGPPPPDTSTPQGERAAEVMDLAQQAQATMGGVMGQLAQKMAAQAAGDWGTGPTAIEHARQYGVDPEVLERVEARARGRA